MNYSIITDTSANVPTPMLKARGIAAVPFSYYADGEEHNCPDTESFDAAAFYGSIRRGAKVDTSLVSPATYTDYFRPVLEAGRDILFIGMSSGISGSFEKSVLVSRQLLEEFPERRIECVDSRGASLGEGLLALKAAELKEEGLSLQDNAERIRVLVPGMCQVFTVDDLMHLRRTGRLSNAAAVIASVLNIKPLLKGDGDGRIVSFAKLMGRRRSVEALADQYGKLVEDPSGQVVGIAHADCRKDADYLAELIRRYAPPKEILMVDYEPVTGSHVGPGALALFFMGSRDFRTGARTQAAPARESGNAGGSVPLPEAGTGGI